MGTAKTRQATVYRMATPEHLCPFGLKSVDLLKRRGYSVDDYLLESRYRQDAFKAQHGVDTTPQTFIDGKRIGGYDDLRRHVGLSVADPDAVSYRPVLVVFLTAALLALAAGWAAFGSVLTVRTAEWVIAFSMAILAMLKLQDIESFSTMFLGYDLLARRWVPYSYVYPYAELLAGVLMAAGVLLWVSVPVALFIGGVGGGLGVQGGLCRPALDQMRLRRRRQPGAPRFRLADREPDDDRDGGVDAGHPRGIAGGQPPSRRTPRRR